MNKNTMYGLLACTVIALGAGAVWMTSQQKNVDGQVDRQGMSFKTQSVSFPCNNTAQTGIPAEECQALVALYYATDGDNWTRNDNWLDMNKPASTWYGVSVVSGKVYTLKLGNNQLSGPIPVELGQLSNLVWLSLRGNQLSGPIPAELGQLSKLKDLDLGNNQFSGPIPVELGQLSNLELLSLGNNQISGPIPAELGQLSKLRAFDIKYNQLSGPIPAELGQLSKLTTLTLNDNQLSGPIPAELVQLSKLQTLWLHRNQLSGPIPVELGQMVNLGFLSLNNNQLCGAIPTSFMYNGVWNPNSEPNKVSRTNNNLLDDQASYSAAMRGWLKSKGFVNANSNRIRDQTPEACGNMGDNGDGGQIGDSCGGENGECAEGYCFGYQPGKCVMGRHKGNAGSSNDPCAPITNENNCKTLQVDANGDGTIDKGAQCNWIDEQPGICKEEICGDGILDPREQCDGKGQAQCGKGSTCSTTGKSPCTCQFGEVIGPVTLPDTTTGNGDGKPGTQKDTKTSTLPTTRALSR